MNSIKKPNYPNRVHLAQLPTPIQPLERLSKHLGGPTLYIKRDDQTGLATGGNKARKLEFLLAEALAKGCDHLITTGAAQSNHCRQTAAAAAQYGLGCSLVLKGTSPETITGNLLLNDLLGAHFYWAGDQECASVMGNISAELHAMGRSPYQIPLGGSNVVGATGYVLAMEELTQQLAATNTNIDFIVIASGSGGTQAGMVLGAEVYDFRGQILGMSVSSEAAALQNRVAALSTATATHLGIGVPSVAGKVNVNDDYLGGGYGVVSEIEREAVRLLAQLEGILLDPVYTGRAMGGLIDLIRWGAFTRGQTVLFWHTGGTAALPAFTDKLL
ncbi:MAG: D-cysteine desulfhydrase family protein [Ardenticatenaceae bacterium]|nr:D-cysteine desulfhydrase family protein [Anaerolineales bacterium]MCB8922341.1 D-cysteine desulfhydrase family protein [Ardenticatenaceae bacterium]MCB9005603.1 D-cysteine desulfhydrase family protein [Ardenticatenaceae bacterium]